jgi:hypothetical protein
VLQPLHGGLERLDVGLDGPEHVDHLGQRAALSGQRSHGAGGLAGRVLDQLPERLGVVRIVAQPMST